MQTSSLSSNSPQVSILVPIYNVAKFLPHCLESLLRQTLTSLEIICINDGSTDNSLEIIHHFAAQDPRVIVINKLNTGYGDSMNYGLREAKGKYIGILESDDWIEFDAFQKLFQLAESCQADIVKANHFRDHTSGESVKNPEILPEDAGFCFCPRAEKKVFRFGPAIWSQLYRREFLEKHKINFLPTPGASYQDISFNFKVWSLAERAILTDEAFVYYLIDNASSSINNPGKVYCVVEEYAEVERFLRESGLYEQLSGELEVAKFLSYHWNLQRLEPRLAKEFYQRFRAEFVADDQAGLLRKSDFGQKNWLPLQMILHHPKLAYDLLRARKRIRQHLSR